MKNSRSPYLMIPFLHGDVSIKISPDHKFHPKRNNRGWLHCNTFQSSNKTLRRGSDSFREWKKLPLRYTCPAVMAAQSQFGDNYAVRACNLSCWYFCLQLVARFRVRLYKCRTVVLALWHSLLRLIECSRAIIRFLEEPVPALSNIKRKAFLLSLRVSIRFALHKRHRRQKDSSSETREVTNPFYSKRAQIMA